MCIWGAAVGRINEALKDKTHPCSSRFPHVTPAHSHLHLRRHACENKSPSGVQELWMALEEMVTSGPGWLTLRRQTLDFISPYLFLFLSPSIFTFLCVSVSPDPFFLVAWVRVPSRGAHRTMDMGFMERWNCFFYQLFFSGVWGCWYIAMRNPQWVIKDWAATLSDSYSEQESRSECSRQLMRGVDE